MYMFIYWLHCQMSPHHLVMMFSRFNKASVFDLFQQDVNSVSYSLFCGNNESHNGAWLSLTACMRFKISHCKVKRKKIFHKLLGNYLNLGCNVQGHARTNGVDLSYPLHVQWLFDIHKGSCLWFVRAPLITCILRSTNDTSIKEAPATTETIVWLVHQRPTTASRTSPVTKISCFFNRTIRCQ